MGGDAYIKEKAAPFPQPQSLLRGGGSNTITQRGTKPGEGWD